MTPSLRAALIPDFSFSSVPRAQAKLGQQLVEETVDRCFIVTASDRASRKLPKLSGQPKVALQESRRVSMQLDRSGRR
jgi:hypothetical protein